MASARKTATPPPPPGLNRVSFAKIREPLEVPDLLALQTDSFDWLLGNDTWQARVAAAVESGASVPTKSGLEEIFTEISPIEDFSETMSLSFRDHRFEPPKYTVEQCREKDMTYSQPMFVTAEFTNNETGEIKSQTVFMGDFPLMTEQGHVHRQRDRARRRVAAGPLARRVLRAPGGQDLGQGHLRREDHPQPRCLARVRDRQEGHGRRARRPQAQAARQRAAQGAGPLRGADPRALRRVAVDGGHAGEGPGRHQQPETQDEALLDIYRKLRPGEPPTIEAGRTLLDNFYFNPKRYDLAKVGRYKVNKKLGLAAELGQSTLTIEDIEATIEYLCRLHAGEVSFESAQGTKQVERDDIDHFGNRRMRTVGELIQNQLRTGLSRMERVVRERMTTQDVEAITPQTLINIRPVVASIKEFFGTSQLSQFMDQTNPVSGLTHKRRLSTRSAPAACPASGPASRSATCTRRTTAACARSRPPRVRTSA